MTAMYVYTLIFVCMYDQFSWLAYICKANKQLVYTCTCTLSYHSPLPYNMNEILHRSCNIMLSYNTEEKRIMYDCMDLQKLSRITQQLNQSIHIFQYYALTYIHALHYMTY